MAQKYKNLAVTCGNSPEALTLLWLATSGRMHSVAIRGRISPAAPEAVDLMWPIGLSESLLHRPELHVMVHSVQSFEGIVEYDESEVIRWWAIGRLRELMAA